jgi:hypothetical protein
MGVEVTRLECVCGVSALEAEPILEAAFEANPDLELAPREDDLSELFLVEDGDWLVIVDSDPRATESWAAILSKGLRKTAISITAYSDFDTFSIHRYSSGKLTGKLEVDDRAERDKDRRLQIRAPFLSNLIASKPKPALAKPILVGRSAHESVLMIARAAGLPTPRDRYQGRPENAALCIRVRNRSARVREERARALREREQEEAPPEHNIMVATPPRDTQADNPLRQDRPVTRPNAWATGPTVGELTAIEGRAAAAGEADILLDVQDDHLRDDAFYEETTNTRGLGRLFRSKLSERPWLVVRMQWDAAFDDVEASVLGSASALGDALIGVGEVDIDLRAIEDLEVPIRVGGPLARSSSEKGRAIWEQIRMPLREGAELSLWGPHGSALELRHYVKGSRARANKRAQGYERAPIALVWSLPAPTAVRETKLVAKSVDAVFRSAVSTKAGGLIEAIAIAQGEPRRLEYESSIGLANSIRKRKWFASHVAGPAWRLFIPAAAAKKLKTNDRPNEVTVTKTKSGGLLYSASCADPFSMTEVDEQALVEHLRPAIGTKKELARFEQGTRTKK